MHSTSICGMRTAVLGGSFSTSTLRPFAHANSNLTRQLYHAIPSARTASTATANNAARTLKTSVARPQKPIPSLSSAAAPRRAKSNAAASPAPSGQQLVRLDWDSFFKLRASRRRYTLASSVVTSAFTTVLGMQVLSSQDLEGLGAQVMGLDPFVVLGMATAACGAAGWLLGPFVGNSVWGLIYRRYKPSLLQKEKQFYDRIRRFRVDPSSNSIANPVPDYYGEKIGSVQGYRQWLKDQRAYNRKRRHFIA
ncbi:Pam17-domain-containing protein [Aspergillus japonicus CBS 114.51]|uniref:Presequence translocated-associated motor subunit PAM17 n=2 Tax=Aspergillus TaxID=5052 RepID=A0A2V5HEP7_ASPV1|nr:Pam17-domain-containing protein [Aspergillus japonicus CBS 114.51]PYI20892.1 Pam17-domain-containing protein [Aspergillus violaceofuscus CBS 115571]RAH82600.1 Pam17-domain-containing protein [Aspergillus japonicus CBS 114.51]